MDVGRGYNDLSTILFRRCLPIHSKIVSISFGASNLVRLINGDPAMRDSLNAAINAVWPITRSYQVPDHGIGQFEFELGNELNEHLHLTAFKDGGILNKALIMHIIDTMSSLGYQLLVSVDINCRRYSRKHRKHHVKYCSPRELRDVDSFFFLPKADADQALSGEALDAADATKDATDAMKDAVAAAAPAIDPFIAPNGALYPYPPLKRGHMVDGGTSSSLDQPPFSPGNAASAPYPPPPPDQSPYPLPGAGPYPLPSTAPFPAAGAGPYSLPSAPPLFPPGLQPYPPLDEGVAPPPTYEDAVGKK